MKTRPHPSLADPIVSRSSLQWLSAEEIGRIFLNLGQIFESLKARLGNNHKSLFISFTSQMNLAAIPFYLFPLQRTGFRNP